MTQLRKIITITIGLIIGTSAFAMSANVNAKVSPAQKTEFEQIIREFIINNPEILSEAQREMQRRDREESKREAKDAIRNNSDALFHGNDPVVGNPKGDVTIVEFFDYNCGYCKKMLPVISELIEVDKNVRIVMKEYPIFGDVSNYAARAAMAAKNQGKYFELHSALMGKKGRVTKEDVDQYAKDLGLDMDKLKKDMDGTEIANAMTVTRQVAKEIGVSGTPAFVIAPDGDDRKLAESDKFFFSPGATSLQGLQRNIEIVRKG